MTSPTPPAEASDQPRSTAQDADTPRRAMVTGATAGIGREFAEQLAAAGSDLILVARDAARLEDTASELRERHGVEVEVVVADLVDRKQLVLVEQRLRTTERPVDLLINNAGFGLKQRFDANDVEAEQAMLDVLVVAVMRLSHAAIAQMTDRGHGGIINVSSVAGFLPRGTYSAAKAWVNSFGEWAATEYGPRGVRITTLCPGFTKTEFHERMEVSRSSAPSFLWLEADRLVRDALADHAAGRAFSVPGKRYKALIGGARIVPTRLLQRAQTMGRK